MDEITRESSQSKVQLKKNLHANLKYSSYDKLNISKSELQDNSSPKNFTIQTEARNKLKSINYNWIITLSGHIFLLLYNDQNNL